MPHRQPPSSVRAVAGPVMDRRRLELVELLVVVPAVVLQRVQTRLALLRIEPAAREQHPQGVNALFDLVSRLRVQARRHLELDTQTGRYFEARTSRAQLPNLNVMRRPVLAVGVALGRQHPSIEGEAL